MASFPIDTVSLPDFYFNPPVHPRKFRCCEIVALGIHSSIIEMNFCSHRSHAVSILDILRKNDQSVLTNNRFALSKSAWAYLQMVRLLVFTGHVLRDHFKVTLIPLWSELPSGGITLQLTNWDGTDISTRSIRVELPELLKWVGLGTTCVSTKLCKKLDNLLKVDGGDYKSQY